MNDSSYVHQTAKLSLSSPQPTCDKVDRQLSHLIHTPLMDASSSLSVVCNAIPEVLSTSVILHFNTVTYSSQSQPHRCLRECGGVQHHTDKCLVLCGFSTVSPSNGAIFCPDNQTLDNQQIGRLHLQHFPQRPRNETVYVISTLSENISQECSA